jgi:hypothetical protein
VVANIWAGAIIRAVLIIGLLFLTQACGARYHLKRAIAKDPTILDSVAVKVDTMVITESKAIHDTLVLKQYDTIEIKRDGVRVEIKRLYDTLHIEAECLPDTIQIEKVVKVPQVVYEEKRNSQLINTLLILSIFLANFALIRFLLRK